MECALKESGADDLTVITSTGSELKLAKSEVRKVETEDGIRDGVLMCAAGEGADYTTNPHQHWILACVVVVVTLCGCKEGGGHMLGRYSTYQSQ